MELEKIRAADTAVRWQDDDDTDNCPNCKSAFSVTRRKVLIKLRLTNEQNYSIFCYICR